MNKGKGAGKQINKVTGKCRNKTDYKERGGRIETRK